MIAYEGGNIAGLQQKLTELNATVPQPLNEADQKAISALLAILKEPARYHSTKVTEDQMRIVVKRLLVWPPDALLPVLDLLRLLFTHTHATEILSSYKWTPSLFETVYSIASGASAVNAMLALRTFANIFKNQVSRKLLEPHIGQLIQLLNTTGVSDNKGVAQASTTLLLNFSVAFRAQPNEHWSPCLVALRTVLSHQPALAPDVLLRAVIAVGTLASLPGATQITRTIVPIDVFQAHCSSEDKDLKSAAQELVTMLSKE